MAEHAPELFTTEDPELATAMEGHDAGHTEHVEPSAFGLTPGGWVGLSMLVFLLILVWKGVHKAIAGGLDGKIAAIREQLDEAKKLREEAEALRAEYAAKIANAEKDAAAMLDHARTEAEQIVAKAEADTEAVIARRKQMAEDKIAAAERGAIEELRATVASAATAAARGLIAEKHDASADRKLVEETISAL
ncbi:F-type H+-transporting ATPase subunit b [Altererythrobacter atlanticus]|uniref:ATP synthase subunit b n=1 Tax=Croceibacterium atlanticum TaxID=1267766 RepID=A0A0F7KQ64_9SPHN|nr:ATP synthase subunit B [Croceibacterium atlanticum]AKH41271.1 ATP synthase subunit b precursor [Croceibacterium atlanticum]MBB5732789.1 F-type H+-transporting ATPase subunit b [Croceibacterium atlanticum]